MGSLHGKTRHERLAEFVRQRMDEQNLSVYDVARRSGGLITHSTVWSIVNGATKDPKLSTLIGLAKGIGVELDELIRVIEGRSQSLAARAELEALFYQLLELDEEHWRELNAVMNFLKGEVKKRLSEQREETGRSKKRQLVR